MSLGAKVLKPSAAGAESARSIGLAAAIAVLVAACVPADIPTPTETGPTVRGFPLACAPAVEADECLERADVGLRSLVEGHPPVSRITVTCAAERCDEDEGVGQVLIHFTDGTREVVDIGFGVTN